MEHQNPRVTAKGHQTVMPYLILKNATSFIEFAKDLFGMELQYLNPRSEGIVAHAELRNEVSTIMVADASDEWKAIPAGLFIYVNDTDETYARALELGCSSAQEPCDMPYGRAAGVRDEWGNTWWLTTLNGPE